MAPFGLSAFVERKMLIVCVACDIQIHPVQVDNNKPK